MCYKDNMGKTFNIAKYKQQALQAALQQGLLQEDSPLLVLVNQQGIVDTANSLQQAFPDGTRHCFAVKANPYLEILKLMRNAGLGAEVASAPELELALQAGFSPKQIVFDAPVKTQAEIERALKLGIAFNIDNFQELVRVAQFMSQHSSTSSIGFRINPQIGAGAVASTSTATLTSKFGIGLNDEDNRQKIINACKQYPWINTIHVHVGSVACPVSLMTQGISVAFDLAEEINQTLDHPQIKHLDIGGGLPVDFEQDGDNPSFKDYVNALKQQIPALFNASHTFNYQITTEFGRAIIAKNAMTIGRIEYTKQMGGRQIALSHIGVQTLTRTVIEPEYWKRRISAFTSQGQLKTGHVVAQDIAGPACFSGDLIARNREMPQLEAGDYILVHDTGSYHFSNHYQYNALPHLPVYGFKISKNGVTFKRISKGQSLDDVISDYS